MKSLRSRLIFSHILPLLLVTPLVAAVLIYLLESQVLLAELSQALTERAGLIASALALRTEVWTDPEQAREFVGEVALLVSGQFYLLDASGNLLASTDPQALASLDPGALRQALSGERSLDVAHGILETQGVILVPITDVNRQLLGIVGVTEDLQGIAGGFGDLRRLVLLILLAQLLLAAVIGSVLAVGLARPIRRSANAVVEIADGRPVRPLPAEGPEELRRLADAVNRLAERLRRLEETRRRSLANIVHEIGRPLGAIRSAAHVLRGEPGKDPEVRDELLAGIETSVERMQPLLDDLAQLHGQVTGSIQLQRQPVAPGDWLPPLLLPWRAAALDAQAGLDWQADVPGGLPEANFDPQRMAQAVGNLLSNAIKYTPAGGSVGVSAGAGPGELWIAITDSGPGIAPEDQARIFEPFYRGRQPGRFPQGLGLGLTLARDLVEAHGGRLELESAPGQGSRFTIRLPVQAAG